MNQGKKNHRSVYSNTSVNIERDDNTCHKGYGPSVQGSNDLFQNSQKILPDYKMRQCDPNDCQESIMFEKAEVHGLSIEYAFKTFLSEGLKILFDTGQPLF